MWERNVGSNDIAKLEAAELKLYELNTNKATLGKEAAAAMAAVEAQQQKLTVQRLTTMVTFSLCVPNYAYLWIRLDNLDVQIFFMYKVEAERSYHQHVLRILDHLEEEVLLFFIFPVIDSY